MDIPRVESEELLNKYRKSPNDRIWQCSRCGAIVWQDRSRETFDLMQDIHEQEREHD